VAAGIWNDGDGNGSIIEDNIIEDNERGIHWEGSVNGIIRGNILRRNSDQGIYLSTARDTLVENNVLEDNFRGIVIFINCFTTMQGWAWAPDLRNDTIRNNTTKMSTAPGEIPAIFSWAAGHFNGSTQDNGCTDPQVQPYLDNTKNNWFSGNKYYVTDVNGWLWYWVSSKNFSAWKTLGQDTTGSVYPVSQYSTQSTFSPCDVSQDNATNVADVQLCVNQGLGSLACGRGDINKDGFCNVVDVQRVVNAALGGQCVSP